MSAVANVENDSDCEEGVWGAVSRRISERRSGSPETRRLCRNSMMKSNGEPNDVTFEAYTVDLGNGRCREIRFGVETPDSLNIPVAYLKVEPDVSTIQIIKLAEEISRHRVHVATRVVHGHQQMRKLWGDDYRMAYAFIGEMCGDPIRALEFEYTNFVAKHKWAKTKQSTVNDAGMRKITCHYTDLQNDYDEPDWLFGHSLKNYEELDLAMCRQRTLHERVLYGAPLPKPRGWHFRRYKEMMKKKHVPIKIDTPSKNVLVAMFLGNAGRNLFRQYKVRYFDGMVDLKSDNWNGLIEDMKQKVKDVIPKSKYKKGWRNILDSISVHNVIMISTLFKQGPEAIKGFEKENFEDTKPENRGFIHNKILLKKMGIGKEKEDFEDENESWSDPKPLDHFFRYFTGVLHYETNVVATTSPYAIKRNVVAPLNVENEAGFLDSEIASIAASYNNKPKSDPLKQNTNNQENCTSETLSSHAVGTGDEHQAVASSLPSSQGNSGGPPKLTKTAIDKEKRAKKAAEKARLAEIAVKKAAEAQAKAAAEAQAKAAAEENTLVRESSVSSNTPSEENSTSLEQQNEQNPLKKLTKTAIKKEKKAKRAEEKARLAEDAAREAAEAQAQRQAQLLLLSSKGTPQQCPTKPQGPHMTKTALKKAKKEEKARREDQEKAARLAEEQEAFCQKGIDAFDRLDRLQQQQADFLDEYRKAAGIDEKESDRGRKQKQLNEDMTRILEAAKQDQKERRVDASFDEARAREIQELDRLAKLECDRYAAELQNANGPPGTDRRNDQLSNEEDVMSQFNDENETIFNDVENETLQFLSTQVHLHGSTEHAYSPNTDFGEKLKMSAADGSFIEATVHMHVNDESNQNGQTSLNPVDLSTNLHGNTTTTVEAKVADKLASLLINGMLLSFNNNAPTESTTDPGPSSSNTEGEHVTTIAYDYRPGTAAHEHVIVSSSVSTEAHTVITNFDDPLEIDLPDPLEQTDPIVPAIHVEPPRQTPAPNAQVGKPSGNPVFLDALLRLKFVADSKPERRQCLKPYFNSRVHRFRIKYAKLLKMAKSTLYIRELVKKGRISQTKEKDLIFSITSFGTESITNLSESYRGNQLEDLYKKFAFVKEKDAEIFRQAANFIDRRQTVRLKKDYKKLGEMFTESVVEFSGISETLHEFNFTGLEKYL